MKVNNSIMSEIDASHKEEKHVISQLDPEAVRNQLEQILASPHFVSSPRCQVVFRYLVEETLKGNAASLKERTIGIQVFKREPTYDTNADPVVRMAISEIRKKLAQHYYESNDHEQIQIKLPSHSYIPAFVLGRESASSQNSSAHPSEILVAGASVNPDEPAHPVHSKLKLRPLRKQTFVILAICGAAVCAGILAWRNYIVETPAEKFWAPIVKSPNPALLCVGGIGGKFVKGEAESPADSSTSPGSTDAKQNVFEFPRVAVLGDSVALADIAGLLRGFQKSYSIRGDVATSYEDLEKGPALLIGAFNNDWAIRFTRSMRFRFERSGDGLDEWISDQQNVNARIGAIKNDMEVMKNQKSDSALVARIIDTETKQPIIIIAGLTPSGNWAAGEFVSNPQYLTDFLKTLPKNWDKKNLEILLNVNVLNGVPGPPKVIANSQW